MSTSNFIKTDAQRGGRTKTKSRSRKRSYREAQNAQVMKCPEEIGGHNTIGVHEEPTVGRKRSARCSGPKKRKKTTECHQSSDLKKPLKGTIISVSTLSDNTKTRNASTDHTEDESVSYNNVCRLSRELGAEVIDLVCKRVHILVCSEAAVRQATQRVRKAMKRNKPLVSVMWLEQCRTQGCKVAFDEYQLNQKAKVAIQKREDRLRLEKDVVKDGKVCEYIPDTGWSEPKSLGCCCVCHENGTTADCPWCTDCKV